VSVVLRTSASSAESELRRGLADVLDVPVASLTIEERSAVDQGTVPKEIVTIRTGGTLRHAFCKHGVRPEAAEERGGTALEAAVYREVLSRISLSTPGLLGAYRRRDGGTTLVLEAAPGAVRLSEASVEAMPAAAAWLGSFHRATEGYASNDLPLPEVGQQTWRAHAERTLVFAERAGVAAPWLRQVCSSVASADDLLSGPHCVVHGEFTVHNVVVVDSEILPTDWECAAIGPGVLDLAQLVERWPLGVRKRCARSYCQARWPEDVPAGFDRDLAVARAFVALRWLAFRPDWVVKETKAWRLDELGAASVEAGLL